jgi:hypothetical protein
MEVLKIEEGKRQELTNIKIVINTYTTIEGDEIDAIVIDYENLYPNFEKVEVLEYLHNDF